MKIMKVFLDLYEIEALVKRDIYNQLYAKNDVSKMTNETIHEIYISWVIRTIDDYDILLMGYKYRQKKEQFYDIHRQIHWALERLLYRIVKLPQELLLMEVTDFKFMDYGKVEITLN